jgi:hypothetical protein
MLSGENAPTHLSLYFYDVIWWKRSYPFITVFLWCYLVKTPLLIYNGISMKLSGENAPTHL